MGGVGCVAAVPLWGGYPLWCWCGVEWRLRTAPVASGTCAVAHSLCGSVRLVAGVNALMSSDKNAHP